MQNPTRILYIKEIVTYKIRYKSLIQNILLLPTVFEKIPLTFMVPIQFTTRSLILKMLISQTVFDKMTLAYNSTHTNSIFEIISQTPDLTRIFYIREIVTYKISYKKSSIKNFDNGIGFQENGTILIFAIISKTRSHTRILCMEEIICYKKSYTKHFDIANNFRENSG